MLLGEETKVYRGYDGVREMFRAFYDALDEIHVEYSEIRDLGDRVVGIGRGRTRGKASGAATESPFACHGLTTAAPPRFVRPALILHAVLPSALIPV